MVIFLALHTYTFYHILFSIGNLFSWQLCKVDITKIAPNFISYLKYQGIHILEMKIGEIRTQSSCYVLIYLILFIHIITRI